MYPKSNLQKSFSSVNNQLIFSTCFFHSVSRTMYSKLRNYNRKCLKSLARQLFSIMLRGMRKQMKSICTDPVDQKSKLYLIDV